MSKLFQKWSLKTFTPNKTALLVCDMQQKFVPHIHNFNLILKNCNRVIDSCKELKISIISTEQYPKGLGSTVKDLHLEDNVPIEKTQFSMSSDILNRRIQENVTDILLAGIESHVCILQTAMDLIDKGYNVHLLTDAISSRSAYDRKIGLERAVQSGAFWTTTESVMFQLLKDSTHPSFKTVQNYFKDLIEFSE